MVKLDCMGSSNSIHTFTTGTINYSSKLCETVRAFYLEPSGSASPDYISFLYSMHAFAIFHA